MKEWRRLNRILFTGNVEHTSNLRQITSKNPEIKVIDIFGETGIGMSLNRFRKTRNNSNFWIWYSRRMKRNGCSKRVKCSEMFKTYKKNQTVAFGLIKKVQNAWPFT